MKYSLQIPKNKIIWILGYNHWGVLGITKLSNPQLQENSMSKKTSWYGTTRRSIKEIEKLSWVSQWCKWKEADETG